MALTLWCSLLPRLQVPNVALRRLCSVSAARYAFGNMAVRSASAMALWISGDTGLFVSITVVTCAVAVPNPLSAIVSDFYNLKRESPSTLREQRLSHVFGGSTKNDQTLEPTRPQHIGHMRHDDVTARMLCSRRATRFSEIGGNWGRGLAG